MADLLCTLYFYKILHIPANRQSPSDGISFSCRLLDASMDLIFSVSRCLSPCLFSSSCCSIFSNLSRSFSAFLSRLFWALDTFFSLTLTCSNWSVTSSTSGTTILDVAGPAMFFISSSSFSCFSFKSASSLAISSVTSFFFFLSPLLAVFFRLWILA